MTALAVPPTPDSQRLRRGGDVRAVFAARNVAHGRSAVVHAALREDADSARWTVVAGRKVGDAVRRNRAKRRLRGVLADLPLPPGADLVVVARSATPTTPHDELQAEVAALVDKALAKALARAGDR